MTQRYTEWYQHIRPYIILTFWLDSFWWHHHKITYIKGSSWYKKISVVKITEGKASQRSTLKQIQRNTCRLTAEGIYRRIGSIKKKSYILDKNSRIINWNIKQNSDNQRITDKGINSALLDIYIYTSHGLTAITVRWGQPILRRTLHTGKAFIYIESYHINHPRIGSKDFSKITDYIEGRKFVSDKHRQLTSSI